MSNIFNGITKSKRSPEPDYNDPSWDEKVSNVGQKAKQAEVLKSKGKEPKTRWNPETKKYYVDFSDVDESVGLPYPGTYEETNDMFKGSGQRRIGTLTTENDDPFRGTSGRFNRGDDERHDLDPTDWYIVKDGKMFAASIYPRQVQQAIAQGFSRTKQEARAKAGSEGVAEGLDYNQRARLDDLIDTYRNATDPSNDGYGIDDHYDPDEVLDKIRQEFGDNVANKVEAGTDKMHFLRHGNQRGDPLGWRKPVDRITKAGKLYKQDSDYMKNTIKSRYKLSGKSATEGVAEGSGAVCPICHSADIKTYSDGEKECNHCHKTWDVQGVAEGVSLKQKHEDKKRADQNQVRYGKMTQAEFDKKWTRTERPKPTDKEQGVAEGPQDDPEDYRAHLLKTLPQMMNFLAKSVKGWKPTEEQYLAAIETGYQVMKHTGDVQQAGRAMSDELNTLHRMSQNKSGMMEEKQRLDPKCWTGKHKEGTKMKGGVRVNNCVPNESAILEGISQVDEGWKSALGSAALAGAMALGAGGAHGRVVPGQDDPGINRLTGKPNVTQVAPSDEQPAAKAPSGYSAEYLQSIIDGTHPRPMLSVEKAKQLLQQQQQQQQQQQGQQ